ncbi:hypothetical protein [Kitasatospora sp. NPDC056731]|uniref:hypothetical protein n=1 Tax=Kitasatospora sp. NPDC056731 TaxID=3155422 RepID=UPI00342A9140
MAIKAGRLNVIAAAVGIAGLLLLATRTEPALAGILTGAALSGLACLAVVDRRLSQLAAQGEELAATKAQYDAAFATLSGQRERLRTTMDSELAGRLADLEKQHRSDCLRAKADGYVEGALDALGGRVAPETAPDEAEVISLAAWRPQAPATTDEQGC